MAERRMFSRSVTENDWFLDMPLSSQALYFHLVMNADDDGFIGSGRKIQRMLGCTDDDFKILFSKKYIINIGNGVMVIRHWHINNTIRLDRYHETIYYEEKRNLYVMQDKTYYYGEPVGANMAYQLATQYKSIKSNKKEIKNKEIKDNPYDDV